MAGIFCYALILFRCGFQIFLIRIDIPDIASVLHAVQDIMHGFKRGNHGMVDVVITVLAVTADTVKVIDGIQVIPEAVNILVGIKISRVRLFDLLHMGVDYREVLSIRPIFTISFTAKSENSFSVIRHRESPSSQKYSRPTQTVFSKSFTI